MLGSLAPSARAEERGLYDSHEPLSLTLEAPFSELFQEENRDSTVAATLALENGHQLPVSLTTYGRSRLRECDFLPLKIKIDPQAAAGTPFDGAGTLRVVTHCRAVPNIEPHMLVEYLAYRSYALLTDVALRVRLVRFRYRQGKGRDLEAYGFFREDVDRAAKRLGKKRLEVESVQLGQLEPRQTALVAVFQYMIANTDWSALKGPAGERCCHNAAILGAEAEPYLLLAYDFDQSGLVNPPYAAPDDRLGLKRVTQRRYRGFCDHNDELGAVIDLFNERRADVEGLFRDPSLPHAAARTTAWRFVNRFYLEINEPKKLSKRVVAWCRPLDR